MIRINRWDSENSWESFGEVDNTTGRHFHPETLTEEITKKKNLYFAFVYLEKTFDQVTRMVFGGL